jgi:hypothetical protein
MNTFPTHFSLAVVAPEERGKNADDEGFQRRKQRMSSIRGDAQHLPRPKYNAKNCPHSTLVLVIEHHLFGPNAYAAACLDRSGCSVFKALASRNFFPAPPAK